MINIRSFNMLRRSFIRCMSSKNSLVDVSVDREGIALITMKRMPVNALNLELFQDLSSAIDTVQKSRCKGFVLTSAAKAFSAGIDLNELNKPDLNRLGLLCSKIKDVFLQIYGSGETISTAAINGYTAAGGCVISLMCDYRVMVADSKARIGLNDTAVGIVPPTWICHLITQVMGHRQADIAITASTMYTVEEALKVHLIDETANNKDDAIEKCKQFIRRYDDIPIKTKSETTKKMRESLIRLVEMNREEDTKLFTQRITDPYVQEKLGMFTQRLKSKK